MPSPREDVENLRRRVRNLHQQFIFPSNTTYDVDVSIPPEQGGQASVRWALLGASRLPVVIKTFKDKDVCKREIRAHITAYIRLYGHENGPVIDPIISTPIVLRGDANRVHHSNRVMAQSLLRDARDLFTYYWETPPPDRPELFKRLRPLIFNALSLLHARGIIHGDICFENIVVYTSTTGQLKVALIDFGMSTILEDKQLSEDDLERAALARMLPKVAADEDKYVDPRSDYAWMYMDVNAFDDYYGEVYARLTDTRLRQQIEAVGNLRSLLDWRSIPILPNELSPYPPDEHDQAPPPKRPKRLQTE